MLALKSEEFFDNGSFNLTIEDEGGKINVNLIVSNTNVRGAFVNLLKGPLRMPPHQADELVNAITDWIDTNSDLTEPGGAESGYYAGLDKPYAAKNAPLDCIEELLMVKGVTRELFYGTAESSGLVRCLTVFGDGTININTAPEPVLRALSAEMTDDAVQLLDEYRRDEKNNLADPNWYKQVKGATGLNIPAGLASIRSDTFRITAVGLQGKMAQRITAVVKRSADRKMANLLSWRVD